MSLINPELHDVDPKEIPCGCELLIYSQFAINIESKVDVDSEFLKSVTALNKPVIVTLGSLMCFRNAKQYSRISYRRAFAKLRM
ncbi:hypothetical protein QTP88_025654 [Uroleucon formosanum]